MEPLPSLCTSGLHTPSQWSLCLRLLAKRWRDSDLRPAQTLPIQVAAVGQAVLSSPGGLALQVALLTLKHCPLCVGVWAASTSALDWPLTPQGCVHSLLDCVLSPHFAGGCSPNVCWNHGSGCCSHSPGAPPGVGWVSCTLRPPPCPQGSKRASEMAPAPAESVRGLHLSCVAAIQSRNSVLSTPGGFAPVPQRAG